MKKRNMNLVLMVILLLNLGCEKVTFLPILGDITGRITDNNGQPVAGATVSATFEAPTEFGQAEQRSRSATTDAEGYYNLTDLWDEVFLRVDHTGLETATTLVKLKGKERNLQVDLTLNGSPAISAVTLNKTVLSIDAPLPDSIFFAAEVEDVYNSQPGSYRGNLLLGDNAGNTRRIIAATVTEQSLDRVLLAGVITVGDLPAGSYQVYMEVIDPDGNTHGVSVGESIRLE